jgi:hypothetical protein
MEQNYKLTCSFCGKNQDDILFICGGTFTGLEKIIQRRLGSKLIALKTSGAVSSTEKRFWIEQRRFSFSSRLICKLNLSAGFSTQAVFRL